MRKLFTLPVLLLFMIGCKKDLNSKEPSNELRVQKLATINTNYVPIDFTELNIGALHNKTIIQWLDTYADSLNQESISNNYKLFFSGVNFGQDSARQDINGQIYDEALVNTVDKAINENYDFNEDTLFSDEAKVYIGELFDAIDSDQDDLSKLIIAVDAVKIHAEQAGVSNFDLDLINGGCIIAKYSAKLWSPVSKGGLGYGNLENSTVRKIVGKMVLADAKSSLVYFSTLGFKMAFGLFVPGTNAAILGGWGITAGVSSAAALIRTELGMSFGIPPVPTVLAFHPENVSLVQDLSSYELPF